MMTRPRHTGQVNVGRDALPSFQVTAPQAQHDQADQQRARTVGDEHALQHAQTPLEHPQKLRLHDRRHATTTTHSKPRKSHVAMFVSLTGGRALVALICDRLRP